ncbi:MAG: class I SAM-dependent methyltransferase [Chloroflexota bacterium]
MTGDTPRPPIGGVRFGDLHRTEPIGRAFGFDRGQPIDRVYIEGFLARHAADVRGRVLEIGDNSYTQRFGGSAVSHSDVPSLTHDNPDATIVADLASAPHIPSATFDCVICTQTLQFVYDVRAAVATLHRILRPAGVLLLTVPGISQVSRFDMDRWGDYWRFTDAALHRLLSDAFGPQHVSVQAHGNALAATSFLHGLAAEDLAPDELACADPDYPVLVTGRALNA